MLNGRISNVSYSTNIAIRLEDTMLKIARRKKKLFSKDKSKLDIELLPDGMALCLKIMRNSRFMYTFVMGREYEEYDDEIHRFIDTRAIGFWCGPILYVDDMSDVNVYLHNGTFTWYVDDVPERRALLPAHCCFALSTVMRNLG